jgi:hypothetical protein
MAPFATLRVTITPFSVTPRCYLGLSLRSISSGDT